MPVASDSSFSSMLSSEEVIHFSSALGQRCQSLASAIVELYTASNRSAWQKMSVGIISLVKDYENRSYFFRLFDMERWECVFEQELYNEFQYFPDRPFFHSFAGDTNVFGLNFANEDEARFFSDSVIVKVQQRQQKRADRHNRVSQIAPLSNDTASSHAELALLQTLPQQRPVRQSVQLPQRKSKQKSKRKEAARAIKKLTASDISSPILQSFIHHVHVGGTSNERRSSVAQEIKQTEVNHELDQMLLSMGVDSQVLDEARDEIYACVDHYGGIEQVRAESCGQPSTELSQPASVTPYESKYPASPVAPKEAATNSIATAEELSQQIAPLRPVRPPPSRRQLVATNSYQASSAVPPELPPPRPARTRSRPPPPPPGSVMLNGGVPLASSSSHYADPQAVVPVAPSSSNVQLPETQYLNTSANPPALPSRQVSNGSSIDRPRKPLPTVPRESPPPSPVSAFPPPPPMLMPSVATLALNKLATPPLMFGTANDHGDFPAPPPLPQTLPPPPSQLEPNAPRTSPSQLGPQAKLSQPSLSEVSPRQRRLTQPTITQLSPPQPRLPQPSTPQPRVPAAGPALPNTPPAPAPAPLQFQQSPAVAEPQMMAPPPPPPPPPPPLPAQSVASAATTQPSLLKQPVVKAESRGREPQKQAPVVGAHGDLMNQIKGGLMLKPVKKGTEAAAPSTAELPENNLMAALQSIMCARRKTIKDDTDDEEDGDDDEDDEAEWSD